VAVRCSVLTGDGSYLGAANAAISGQEIVSGQLLGIPNDNLDAALVLACGPHVGPFIADSTFPLADGGILEVRISAESVSRELENMGPILPLVFDFESHGRLVYSKASECVRVKEISIRGFRSFGDKDQYVALGKLTVLVGANGSGKSNFLEAVDLVGSLVRGERDVASIPFETLHRSGAIVSDVAGISFSFLNDTTYYVSLSNRSKHKWRVSETLWGPDQREVGRDRPVIMKRSVFDGNEAGLAHQRIRFASGISEADVILPMTSDRFLLASMNDPSRFEFASQVRQTLVDSTVQRQWRFGETNHLIDNPPSDSFGGRVRGAGENLGSVLRDLCIEFPAVKDELQRLIGEVLPGAGSLIIGEGTSKSSLEVIVDGTGFALSELSTGTLRWMALLAILLDPRERLICIDEPELGLHPEIMPSLAKLLQRASLRSQLVVSTHQPLLLDALDEIEADWTILAFENERGHTKITESDRDEIEKNWIRRNGDSVSLGDAWLRGAIGGTRW
jgi:predicted ATPase